MLRSVFLLVLRHFARHSTFSMLNLFGLVIGISSALFLSVFVLHEININQYHPDNERVYTVLRDVTLLDGEKFVGETEPAPLADFIRTSIPEVEEIAEVGFEERLLVTAGKLNIYSIARFADHKYFSVFHIPIVEGNAANPMPNSNSASISTTLAKKLFGNESPLGRIITVANQLQFEIKSVHEIPVAANVFEDLILPFEIHQSREIATWDDSNTYLYVKLYNPSDKEVVESKLTNKIHEIWTSKKTNIFLFALSDWHLHWNSVVQLQSQDRLTTVVAFTVIGAFILLMACVNFINLATARATTRGREIGVRKMSGATHNTLVKQFLAESVVITSIAALLSILLTWTMMPLFNFMVNMELSLFGDPRIVIFIVLITLGVALLSGGYPAFILSSLKPASILKGQLYLSLKGGGLRKGLVILQFSLAVILIFSAITMHNQVAFLKSKDLGFDRYNVLYIEPDINARFNAEAFKKEAFKYSNIQYVGQAAASPMEINGIALINWNNGSGEQEANFVNNPVDYDYLPALGFKIIKGRNFLPALASDSSAVIISESAAKMLGFDDPIGKIIQLDDKSEIIGVVKDFHNADIHSAPMPVIFYLGSDFGKWARIFVRYQPGTQKEVVEEVEMLARKIAPGFPTEIHFVDQDVESQFKRDARTEAIFIAFTIVALALASMGLFGLTLFTTQRRSKEMSIRKVLGASVPELTVMLCRYFFIPLVISLAIALPAATWVMNQFLSTYYFHTDIGTLTFVITAIGIFILAFASIGYQSLKTAMQNPANTLKAE